MVGEVDVLRARRDVCEPGRSRVVLRHVSKYVVNRDGKVIAYFPSRVTPDAAELRAANENALAQ
jgi:glutathione peroxidase-family protein